LRKKKMITKEAYEQIMARVRAFDAWLNTIRNPRTGWVSYKPEEVPPNVPTVSNAERSSAEVYEFFHNPPEKYFLYVRRLLVAPGVVSMHIEVTTWTGQLLGKGHLGRPYKCGLSRRYPITFKGINGRLYRGTYYVSAGDYARVKLVKS
jgi:hypothetical protein